MFDFFVFLLEFLVESISFLEISLYLLLLIISSQVVFSCAKNPLGSVKLRVCRNWDSLVILLRGFAQQDRNHFLADLNHRLSAAFEAMPVSGAVASRSFGKSSGGDSSREATWTELKGSMSEQLAGVLSSLERQNDKIRQLEECVRGKERTIDDLKEAQEAQMHKYDALNQSFSLQKKELEEHYNKLIQDMQTKSRVRRS